MGEFRQISLEEARALVKDVEAAMTAESFLQSVDQLVATADPSWDIVRRRQQLLEALLPLHMSVMTHDGFAGEEGYVLAQRALVDHYSDRQIKEAAQRAQAALFTRAGLG